jgi:chromate transporter
VVLLSCGMAELAVRRVHTNPRGRRSGTSLLLVPVSVVKGSIGALAWTALKVGGLAFGGGFVIIPLMQGDAVHTYHWMSNAQFLNAVALGQVTPGPVVATIAAVGYAAHGLTGGVMAAAIAFIPSFSFVLLAGRKFERLRANLNARAFLDGAGPAAVGAILGSAIPLTRALSETWQFAVLAVTAVMLLVGRRGVVLTLLFAGAAGAILALAGAAVPG